MLERYLLRKIQEYLAGRITLTELEEWIAPRAPSFYAWPQVRQVLGTIELGLAEMDEGIITEAEFKRSLEQVVRSGAIFISYPEGEKSDYNYSGSANDRSSGLSYESIGSNRLTVLRPQLAYT